MSGNLGTANLVAATNTTIHTAIAGKITTLNVNICNRGAVAVLVRLATSATGVPTLAEYIEYDVSIPAHGVLERTGVVMEAGRNLVAYSNLATVSVVAYGFEG